MTGSNVSLFGGAALVVGLFYGLFKLLLIGHRPKNYPPGPPTIPILGNLLQIPKHDVHLQMQKWAQEYGPVFSLMLGSKTMIILSSDVAVKELLDKRSAIYSDRPDLFMGQTILSGGLRILMMRYSERWRKIRKMLHKFLNISFARSFEPYQALESKQLLHDLLMHPGDFKIHLLRYSNSVTTATTFGLRTPTYNDKLLVDFFDIFQEFVVLAQTGTASLLDYLPTLRHLPDFLLPPLKRAKYIHQREKALYRTHWDNAKRACQDGTANPCFSVNVVKEQQKHGFSDDQAAYITGTLLEAGSDTTANTLYGFVCALLIHPEVQQRGQEELDRVIGGDRLPTFEDEMDLQYIRGCVKESLRWMPTVLMGAVPHGLTRDDTYLGYFLPAGAGVINNVYSIHQDPARYPDPKRFAPERYKDDFQSVFDAALNADVSKRDQFTFGAGRRICPGLHVAERSLFLGIARMLWAFDFRPQLDENGREIIPDREAVTQGFVSAPVTYQAIITPRSEKRAEMVKKEWEAAVARDLNPETMQWQNIPDAMRNTYSQK